MSLTPPAGSRPRRDSVGRRDSSSRRDCGGRRDSSGRRDSGQGPRLMKKAHSMRPLGPRPASAGSTRATAAERGAALRPASAGPSRRQSSVRFKQWAAEQEQQPLSPPSTVSPKHPPSPLLVSKERPSLTTPATGPQVQRLRPPPMPGEECLHIDLAETEEQKWTTCEECCHLARTGFFNCTDCGWVLCANCATRLRPIADKVSHRTSMRNCDEELWGSTSGPRCRFCQLLNRSLLERCAQCGAGLREDAPGIGGIGFAPRRGTLFTAAGAEGEAAYAQQWLGTRRGTLAQGPANAAPRAPGRKGKEEVTPEGETDHHVRTGGWVRTRRGIEFRVSAGESVWLLGTTQRGWALVIARGRRGWLRGRALAVGPGTARERLRGRCDVLLSVHTQTGRRRICFQQWLEWAELQKMLRSRRECIRNLLLSTQQGTRALYLKRWQEWASLQAAENRRKLLLSQLGRAAANATAAVLGSAAETCTESDEVDRESTAAALVSPKGEPLGSPAQAAWGRLRDAMTSALGRLSMLGGVSARVQQVSGSSTEYVGFGRSVSDAQPTAYRRGSGDLAAPEREAVAQGLEALLEQMDCGLRDEGVQASDVDGNDLVDVGGLRGTLTPFYEQVKAREQQSVVEWVLDLPTIWHRTFMRSAEDVAVGCFLGEDMLCPPELSHAPRHRTPERGALPLIGTAWDGDPCCALNGCAAALNRLVAQGDAAQELGMWEWEDGYRPAEPLDVDDSEGALRVFDTLRRAAEMDTAAAINGICALATFTHRCIPPAAGAGLTAAARLQIPDELCRAMRYYGVMGRMAQLQADEAQRVAAVVAIFAPLIMHLDTVIRSLAHGTICGVLTTPLRVSVRFPLGRCVAWGSFVVAGADVPPSWQREDACGALCIVISRSAAEVSCLSANPAEPLLMTTSGTIHEVASLLPTTLLRLLGSEREVVVFRERSADRILTPKEVVDARLKAAQESGALYSDFLQTFLEPTVGREPELPGARLLPLYDEWLQGVAPTGRRRSRRGSPDFSSPVKRQASRQQSLLFSSPRSGGSRVSFFGAFEQSSDDQGSPLSPFDEARQLYALGPRRWTSPDRRASGRRWSRMDPPQLQNAWLLLGGAGSGTTSAALGLAQRAAERHRDWACIFLAVSAMGQNAVEYGEVERKLLEQLHIVDQREILELRQRRLVVIIEALHELELPLPDDGKKKEAVSPSTGQAPRLFGAPLAAQGGDPVRTMLAADQSDWHETKNFLHRSGLGRDADGAERYPNAKVVITCRPEWMKSHGLTAEHLIGLTGLTSVLYLQPLSASQTESVLAAKAADIIATARTAAFAVLERGGEDAVEAAAGVACSLLPECLRGRPRVSDALLETVEAMQESGPHNAALASARAVAECAEAFKHLLPPSVLTVPLHLVLAMEGLGELQRAWKDLEAAAPGEVWKLSRPGVAEVWEAWLRCYAARQLELHSRGQAPAREALKKPDDAQGETPQSGLLLSALKQPGKIKKVKGKGVRFMEGLVSHNVTVVEEPTALQAKQSEAEAERQSALAETRKQVEDYITLVGIRCFWNLGQGQVWCMVGDLAKVTGGPRLTGDLVRFLPLRRWGGGRVSLKYAGLAGFCAARAGFLSPGLIEPARIRQRGWPRFSLVHEAAVRWGHPGLTAALMARGARTDLKDVKHHQPPIVAAAIEHQGGAMWVLYTTGASRRNHQLAQEKVTEPYEAELRRRGAPPQGEQRLAEACTIAIEQGGPTMCRDVEALLGAWMTKGAESMRNRAPLHFAAACGDPQVVGELEYDPLGVAPAQWQKLVDTHPGVDAVLQGSKFLELCAVRCMRTARALCNTRGALRTAAGDGSTALHNACRQGRTKTTEALVLCGADPSAVDMDQVPPLHLALRHANFRDPSAVTALRMLCTPSALAATEPSGMTALHRCCAEGWVQAAVVLMRQGAEPAITDKAGLIPMHHAMKRMEFSMPAALPALALLASPAALRWRGEDGLSLLHHACREGKSAVACALLDCGGVALIAALDDEGRRPLNDAIASEKFIDEEGEYTLILLAGGVGDYYGALVEEGLAVAHDAPPRLSMALDSSMIMPSGMSSGDMSATARSGASAPTPSAGSDPGSPAPGPPPRYVFRVLASGIYADARPARIEDRGFHAVPPGWEVAPADDVSRRVLAAHPWGSEDGVVLADGGLYSTNASRYSQPGGRYASRMLQHDNRGRVRARQGHVFLRAALPPEGLKHGARARVRIEGFGAAVPATVVGSACRRMLRPFGMVCAAAVRTGGRCVVTYAEPFQAYRALETLGEKLNFEGWQLTATTDGITYQDLTAAAIARAQAVGVPLMGEPASGKQQPALGRHGSSRSFATSADREETTLHRSQSSVSMVSSIRSPKNKLKAAAKGQQVDTEEVTIHRRGNQGLGMLFEQDPLGLVLREVEERSSADEGGLGQLVGWRLIRVNGVPILTIDDARAAAMSAAAVQLRLESPPAPKRGLERLKAAMLKKKEESAAGISQIKNIIELSKQKAGRKASGGALGLKKKLTTALLAGAQ
eukprot:TRINITY_DN2345_c1_g1_i1.p1 TRINITY_DN2345_c1_g1~~TRINITY_DN2345_c1_g1_i1.p1  ORF type:complete len:2622 (+),score=584.37 TRINITY_DN2345_c1_g1_i1:290-7867(+)